MKKRKTYLQLTVIMSVLFGIILPLALGIKDPTLIAITFSSVWFIYSVYFFVSTFFSREALRMRKLNYKKPELN
jgi:CBS domain containing-hemolysin-like protein